MGDVGPAGCCADRGSYTSHETRLLGDVLNASELGAGFAEVQKSVATIARPVAISKGIEPGSLDGLGIQTCNHTNAKHVALQNLLQRMT